MLQLFVSYFPDYLGLVSVIIILSNGHDGSYYVVNYFQWEKIQKSRVRVTFFFMLINQPRFITKYNVLEYINNVCILSYWDLIKQQ